MDQGAQEVEIRPLRAEDLPAAMELKELARWNQTADDWRRLLLIEPHGCFAAWTGGRLVATTTTTIYGRDLAWIGMVLVHPDYRRRGLARLLMKTALDSLQARGLYAIKLDATPEGRHVYEALGFEVELLVERWMGEGARAQRPAASVAPLAAEMLPELFALDRRAFGADRRALLEALLADACAPPLVARGAGGELTGYALARRGTAASYIGPLVAEDEEVAAALLDGALARLNGQHIYIDYNTGFGNRAPLLAERGFAKQRDLFRMRLGAASRAGTSARVFAIAGPETG